MENGEDIDESPDPQQPEVIEPKNPLKEALLRKTKQNNLKKNAPKSNFKGVNLGRSHTVRPRSR